MPYGIAKSAGGDSPSNDAAMESCVAKLQGKGYDKVAAIKICKASIQGTTKRPHTKGS